MGLVAPHDRGQIPTSSALDCIARGSRDLSLGTSGHPATLGLLLHCRGVVLFAVSMLALSQLLPS